MINLKNNYFKMIRKLRRITPGILGGVCEGIGEYTNTDPMMWRLIFILGTIFTWIPFALTYIILWAILPTK